MLQSRDAKLVCKTLCKFVLETRNSSGQHYPPATIRCLLSGLNRILKENKAPFSILGKDDPQFHDLHCTMDSVSSELHKKGIGTEHKHAAVIATEEEDALWAAGSLGTSTPLSLQHTVYFYVGLQFCLRGVQEHYDLVPHQFTRFPADTSIYDNSVYYQYTEFISKNNQHRFKDIDMRNKQVRAYALPESDQCLVKLLDLYLSKLIPNSEHFYMRPLPKTPVDDIKPWYTRQRVGVNTIKQVLQKIFSSTGYDAKYTNHSLRATAITRMFNGNIPEKAIRAPKL